uniref:Uncharacterized protein n=1 Tax=Helianthus annuus TaxID=4232 RepID=A0A251UAB8_HELAN
MFEEVIRIKLSLDLHQPIKILFKIPCSPRTCLDKTCVITIFIIHPKIKISIIHISLSWKH